MKKESTEIQIQSNYVSVPSVPCVPLCPVTLDKIPIFIALKPRLIPVIFENNNYKVVLYLSENWVLGVGNCLVFELFCDGELEAHCWIPSPWREEVDQKDITEWPVWLYLALCKINRNGLKGEKLIAVFIDKLRQVILEETGKDIKKVSKDYAKRFIK